MALKILAALRMVCVGLSALSLCSCFQPPYNDFHPDNRSLKHTIFGAGVGTGVGAIIGAAAGNVGAGALIGGVTGTLIGANQTSSRKLLMRLEKSDIQLVQYGDTTTLIIPTDKYYRFNTAHFNELCYEGLNTMLLFLKTQPCGKIYVAAFTDNIGSKEHKKKLSQAQAETMLTFLWASGIPAEQLQSEGFADKNTIGDNQIIHGSAYNRRIEIQWVNTRNTTHS